MDIASTGWLDAVLVVLLVGSITFGFHQGLLRQVFLLVAIYIGAGVSARYHVYLSNFLMASFPSSSEEIARTMAFVLMLLAATLVITWLVWTAYSQTKLPDVVMLDHLGGAALGGIIGVFAISLTLTLLRFSLDAPWPEGSTIRYSLHSGLINSSLQAAFSSPLPIIQLALRPWLPSDTPWVLDS